ncbi:spermidine synthase [Sulfodiicoccus acidiphilus]|uniref:Polyamine aminopropyltransferase n=1 Tax=Sulfodiicoccus acidiphilus TaxID=1670455 RepID=A0A348B0U1_9CREN|nr:spermidine synthase [Sulfodiicoccus acidiphilus]BBD71793.1 spermidine synthase [Sulfodiicoccus acidiphilus]GGT99234.1 spermidine synthase [Sulfodiicoccus acidiphilus]
MSYNWSWHIEWQTPYEFHAHGITNVFFDKQTDFQRIMLANLHRFGKTLIIDGKIQSSVEDEYIYHESLVHPLLLSLNEPKEVLILGGGEGATLREVLKHRYVRKAVMVDIDSTVIDVARNYMKEWHAGAFEDPRTELVIGDGYDYVKKSSEVFDAVVLDLTDPMRESTSYKLYTKEFYEILSSKVRDGGGIVTQATSPSFSLEVFSVINNTCRVVFGNSHPYITYIPAFDGLWGFVASIKGGGSIIKSEKVDEEVKERIVGELKHYDGPTHASMFNIPKGLRRILNFEKKVSTESNPVVVPA